MDMDTIKKDDNLFSIMEEEIKITASMADEFYQHGRTCVDKILNDSRPMKHVSKKSNIDIYEHYDYQHELYTMKGITNLNGTVYEILSFLKTFQSIEYQKQMKMLLDSYYINGQILKMVYVDDSKDSICFSNALEKNKPLYHPRSIQKRKISLNQSNIDNMEEDICFKWLVLQSPSGIWPHRGHLFLEYSELRGMEDKNNLQQATLGALVWDSVRSQQIITPQFPIVKRSKWNSCGYFLELNEDYSVRVSFYLTEYVSRKSIDKSIKRWMETCIQRMLNIQDYVLTERFDSNDLKAIEFHKDMKCSTCLRTFNWIRRRHHCRICGQSLCSKCSVFVQTLRTCKHCQSHSAPQQSLSVASSFSSNEDLKNIESLANYSNDHQDEGNGSDSRIIDTKSTYSVSSSSSSSVAITSKTQVQAEATSLSLTKSKSLSIFPIKFNMFSKLDK